MTDRELLEQILTRMETNFERVFAELNLIGRQLRNHDERFDLMMEEIAADRIQTKSRLDRLEESSRK